MTPKQQNPKFFREDSRGNTYQAVAPYNFVPLPEQVQAVEIPEVCGHDRYTEDQTHTGYLDCSFTTLTPLYTRAAMRPEFYQQWGEKIRDLMKDPAARESHAQFFHLDQGKAPVVPGSSLRGMVRTLVEIINNSKVQWVTDEALVFRSVGDRTGLGGYYRDRLMVEGPKNYLTPKMVAGYMEKIGHRWFIRPAQSLGGATFARIHVNDLERVERHLTRWRGCQNAYQIWIKADRLDFQKVQGGFRRLKYIPVKEVRATAAPGFQEAVVAKSGKMQNKRREAVIFPPDVSATAIEVDEDLVRRYREQVSQEQGKLLGPEGVLRHGQPVFYLIEESKLVFFGHTMMFRLPYERTPLSFVPEELRKDEVTDLAEAIFGFVAADKGDKRQPRAGRVYFRDARLVVGQEEIWLTPGPMTPKILSSPKPTSFQHYLTQQEPDTVDTGERSKGGDPKTATLLDHYASPPPHETVIRGHKLYWHKAGTDEVAIRETEPVNFASDKQHTQIKPVKGGVQFQFRIHFENLRDFELGALLWALTLPGEAGRRYCHKLGMGKALGMGSIELTVNRLTISARKERYRTVFAEDQWHLAEQDESARIDEHVRAFVTYMAGRPEQGLQTSERIRMLLKMLEYPGPNGALTRYMGLAEFKERPVLPDPLHVAQRLGRGLAFPLTKIPNPEEAALPMTMGPLYSTDDAERTPSVEGQAIVEQLKQRLAGVTINPASAPPTAVEASKLVAKMPQSIEDFVPGAYLQVTVKDVQFNAVLCDTGVKEITARLEEKQTGLDEEEKLADHFTAGQPLEVWVLREPNRKGNVQLTLVNPVKE
jgi:CRISPR-associated protein (TIGR03986 family)